jgi:hypothetical protein
MLGVRPVRGYRFGRTPVSGGLWKLLLRMAARSFEQHQRAWLSSMRRDHMLTGSFRFKKTLSSTLSIFGNRHPSHRNQTISMDAIGGPISLGVRLLG